MDRQIVYPGQIPLETDLLNSNKYALIGLAKLAAAVLGTHTLLNGLGCAPVSPAALQVQLGAGEIYALANLDGTAYSSLAADTAHSLLKQGLLLDAVTLDCPPPATAGDSVVYLVQIGYFDQDSGATALPYYNAANPAQAYSGPNNSGTAQHTVRQGVCQVTVKAGIAATSGSQVAPAPDPGYVGAYLVTVANGQTAITAADIQTDAGAPFITETLTQKISQASGDARYATQSGIQETSYSAANAGGTADALTAGYTPAVAALTHGMTLYVRAAAANTTATPTFTPNSGVIAAKAIVKGAGSALAVGDIAGAGHWLELQYDQTLDRWVLLNPFPLSQPQADARYIGSGYMLVKDEKPSGTAGGDNIVGIQTRVLNTVSANTISGASLLSNQITLPAGTYRIHGSAPANNANLHQAGWYAVTDAAYAIVGTSENTVGNAATDAIATRSFFGGRITITAPKVFELRHYTSQAVAASGLGQAATSGMGPEVYCTIEIIKEL